jgi:mannosyl-3-phosphoglycerate phosphatase
MNAFPIIFSDIDGTILDFENYSYKISLPAIRTLAGKGIPLILVSSKTYIEMLKLHKQLKLPWPFIFENGAGISQHGTYTLYGKSYQKLVQYKPAIEQACGTITWAENLPLTKLSEYTGLSTRKVKDMMARMASVLFIAHHTLDINQINKQLHPFGIAITTGGKFFTVIDSDVNKGSAVQMIQAMYRQHYTSIYSYAIGDGLNDIDMFKAVDEAYFVGKRNLFKTIQTLCPGIHKSRKEGPEGFCEVIDKIVQNYSLT